MFFSFYIYKHSTYYFIRPDGYVMYVCREWASNGGIRAWFGSSQGNPTIVVYPVFAGFDIPQLQDNLLLEQQFP